MTDSVSTSVWSGRSWWKACCGSCCLGMVILAILLAFLSYWYFGHAPQELRDAPRRLLQRFK